MDVSQFLSWLLSTTGPTLGVLALLGYLFREKWKQILTRSMTVELERLKHQLAIEQAQHAASLTPQLESVRHDFQLKLEAYKNSLIAQAEEAKIRGDVKRSIATRYVEIQFERLMAFDKAFSRMSLYLSQTMAYTADLRTAGQRSTVLNYHSEATAAESDCQMYWTPEERMAFIDHDILVVAGMKRVGDKTPQVLSSDVEWVRLVRSAFDCEKIIRQKISAIAQLN